MELFEVVVGIATIFGVYIGYLQYRKHHSKSNRPDENLDSPENIATRFFKLFEAHGVHRNQIPALIGKGLTIEDVQSEANLLPKLTEDLLNYVCELFAVRREWLDGADDQIYPLHDFYKWPEEFAKFLDRKLIDKELFHMNGVVLATKHPKQNDSALIVLSEPVGNVGGRLIYRYHLCHNWAFAYWKARAYLTACVALAWKRNVCLMGRYVDQGLIDRYQEGEVFLNYSDFMESALPLKGEHWHPEDMALKPDEYLNGVDEGLFGKLSALDLWLVEDEKGFMKLGSGYLNTRQSFIDKLEELKASTS